MTPIELEYPREDAKSVVKLAFENTGGIKTYHDNGTRIVGKTGAGLGSYGEKVIVDIHNRQEDEGKTSISIRSEKEVDMNITANPEKYESRFLNTLNRLRGKPVEDLFDSYGKSIAEGSTKEVASPDQQADGKNLLYVVLVIVIVMMFFFTIMPLMAL